MAGDPQSDPFGSTPPSSPTGWGQPGPGGWSVPPAPRGRPSWSDGTFVAVVVLLILAFGSGILLDRSGVFDQGSASAPTTASSGASGASAIGTLGPGHTLPARAPANFGLFWDALTLIRQHFVDRSALTEQAITYGAINGLVTALGDPGHTVFLTPDEVKAEQAALNGSIVGIGVFLGVQGGQPVIQSVISGTPAAKAGVESGDLLIAINGKTALGLTTEQIANLIRGPAGTKVTITVIHPNTTNPVQITITRAQISVPAVSWAMVPGTKLAMIQVIQFSQGASAQTVQAIAAARRSGATGIILDLRSDPGGLVNEAVGVASQFLGSGNVYIRQEANGTKIPVPVQAGGTALRTPLVVLVDYGTASSAEIVAGAIQDAGRAKVVGVRTFGTGTVLNQFPLPDGSALRLAVEEWLTPNGLHIFPNGITPNVVVDLPPGVQALDPGTIRTMTPAQLAAADDTQLAAAIKILAAP